MKIKSSMRLLWMRQWSSQIRKRRVIHSNSARLVLFLWDVTFSHRCWWRLSPVDWWRVTDVSVERSASCAVDPEDEGKMTSRQGEKSQMTCIFNNTAVRISPPTTVVPKRRQETTNRRCAKSQKWADLIYTAFEAWNRATVKCYAFCYQHAKKMNRLRLAGGFLCCVVHMYAGHFRYKKIIPQVKGKKK